MFWNKKVEADRLPITFSLRASGTLKKIGLWHEKVVYQRFLAYKTGDTWNGLVGYEEYKEKTDRLEAKLDLILDHLKLKYVPETETKEPAKLVEKTISLGADWGQFITASSESWVVPSMPCGPTPTKPKKKGRPKKK